MISIVMPVFIFSPPQKEFLKEAFESVLNQTYTDWELIVVDDESQMEYDIPKDDRIKFFKKEHGGAARARNYGIEQMKGEFYLAFDSDDSMSPDRLEKMLEAMKGGDVVYTGFYHCDMHKTELTVKNAEPFDFDRLKKEQYIAYAVMVRKKKLVRYRDKYTANDDYLFLIDLALNGAIFVNLDEPLFIYRRNPMSVSCRSMYDGRKIIEREWIKDEIKKL